MPIVPVPITATRGVGRFLMSFETDISGSFLFLELPVCPVYMGMVVAATLGDVDRRVVQGLCDQLAELMFGRYRRRSTARRSCSCRVLSVEELRDIGSKLSVMLKEKAVRRVRIDPDGGLRDQSGQEI